jgi:hypothetical protein
MPPSSACNLLDSQCQYGHAMDALFSSTSNFASLSLTDLTEARDLFHYHLLDKKNVVATAIGLYRIRKHDPWPTKDDPTSSKPRKPKSERRTLFNSEVRPYSWPCVYVFVSSWEYESALADSDPSDVVPKSLFLPDGRSVPVCVIEARKQPWSKDLKVKPETLTPRNLLGPGAAILNEDCQGMARVATAGCIVHDGERYYVMTNRHAVGATGTTIKVLRVHRRPRIGATAAKGLAREDFAVIYPNLHSTRQRLLMDVGLVDLDDVLNWKTEVPGIAPIGAVLDLYDNSLTLKLVTMKVVGLSAISGLIRGEIHALFYRYKAMGGSEYISDFLIGPETYGIESDNLTEHHATNVALGVHHGDSGTLLFIEHAEKANGDDPKHAARTVYRPCAVLWGREEFFSDNGLQSNPYALATSLSTVLDLLDLDLVTELNSDQTYIWGWVGHYAIGRALALPADRVTSAKLRHFIKKNLDLLSLEPDGALDNDPKVLANDRSDPRFVPLADVPDNVWKSNVNFSLVEGDDGKKWHKPGPGSRGQNDNPNHFADLDLEYKDGKIFLQLNAEDPDTYLKPAAWIAYFAAMKPQFDKWEELLGSGRSSNHWGALPFRVHQLFDIMVRAATEKDAALFLCAGGVLIHYVGDACQPLHASYLSQGDPARVVDRPRSSAKKLEADGVHSGYEDDMIAYGYQNENLAAKLKDRINDLKTEDIPVIASGYGASKAIIGLIAATREEITPRAIVDQWVKLNGTPRKEKAAAMWDAFGESTITCLARGTHYLARIWQAAWTSGTGDATIDPDSDISQDDIAKLYNNPDVAPSLALDHYPDDVNADWSMIRRAN